MDKIEFWKEKDKQLIDPGLFSTRAEALARRIADDHKLNSKENKRTQIRKFFDEIVHLDMTAKSRPKEEWAGILPLVHMMTAKAAYAKGRKLISNSFLQFIKESVEQVEEPQDLSVFATFFEAFIGFYRLHGPSN